MLWILADDRPGNLTQSLGLAQALGRLYEVKDIRDRLLPPWPSLVIACGERTAPVAEWVKRQSGGEIRAVQIGRKGGRRLLSFDAVVAPFYARLPPAANLIETRAPLCRIDASRLRRAADRHPEILSQAASPRIVVLVGGYNSRFLWNSEIAARMAEELAVWTRAASGSLWLLTSRRTGDDETAVLRERVGDRGRVIAWGEEGDAYLAYLAKADVLVVTGDSESMLAEALATAHPVYVYPLPPQLSGLKRSLRWQARTWLYLGARNQSFYRYWVHRGKIRPPPRDFQWWHRYLQEQGQIRIWSGREAVVRFRRDPLREAHRVARILRRWNVA